ncbi:MAG: hypothetical protein C5B52_05430 [Bacteroidetes bacterium]|nr:MAG: hypothetical protein C5B52_05430 [Bacteroidota bacterium]
MRYKTALSLFLLVAAYYVIILTGSGCAQIIPPTGGPRDTLPPVLVSAVPKDSMTNFTGNKIVLTFDEYIQLDNNMLDQLVLSPTPKINPVIEAKLKTVTIKIKDTLEPNTTYAIGFGKGLKDLNEGNILKDFTYIFSTGTTFDNSTLSGKIILASNGKTDSTLIAMLYRNLDDSAVAKEKPRYYARSDAKGNFTFHNLAPGRYHAFALKDASGQKMYQRNSDLFAFLDSPITISSSGSSPIVLYAFEGEPEPVKTGGNKSSTQNAEKRVKFNTNLDNGRQDLLSKFELNFEKPLRTVDSSKFVFTDTLFNPVTGFQMEEDTTRKKISFKYPWKEDQFFRLIIDKSAVTDTLGNQLSKSDTIKIKTKENKEYGRPKFRITNLDTSKHIVLLFMKDGKLTRSERATSREFSFPLFVPGDYEIYILYDRNNNGKWDTGNYWQKIQPEKVISDGKKYNVRADWDNEILIELRRE